MHTLIAFATNWGSKFGGINSFNTDFLCAFGVAYHLSAQVVCIVVSATEDEIDDAQNAHVRLVPLPFPPRDGELGQTQAFAAVDELKKREINFDPNKTIWLGHDRITGAAAICAARTAGGRSAVIHHMSYADYESYAEDSETADLKTECQTNLFKQADLAFAVGPLLRDAMMDRIGDTKPIHMLIPGLPEIEVRRPPKTFTAFVCGRLIDNTAKIKQGHLGVAAFARAHRDARESETPECLSKQPKLMLRGVDFEAHPNAVETNPEIELKKFAESYASGVINLIALPYTVTGDLNWVFFRRYKNASSSVLFFSSLDPVF